jgi:hypothetical protein
MYSLSPTYKKSQFHSKIKSIVSLPSLNRPQRDQVEALIQNDKEKTKQKLKENYFKNDISYLKDKISDQSILPSMKENLPLNMNEILNSAYNIIDTSIDQTITSYLSSTPKATLPIKLNSPARPYVDSAFVSVSAPTGRQEALQLKSWLELMESKYITVFADLINGKDFIDKSLIIKAWKSIYIVAMKEMHRQVTVQCLERGNLLQRIINGYENIYEINNTKSDQDTQTLKNYYEDKINHINDLYTDQIVILQQKVSKLEQEKEQWRHFKAEIIIKTKELIRYLEKLRKYEDKIKNFKGKSSYFDEYAKFIDKIAAEEDKDPGPNISDKLKDDIKKKIEIINSMDSDINKNKQRLKDLNLEINDKECVLSTLELQIETKKTTKNKKKIMSKPHPATETEEQKISVVPPKFNFESERIHHEKFFSVLMTKSKDRLIKKAKVTQEHIFKSLIVIYNRSIIQIDSESQIQKSSFSYLVYKQFMKSETRKKSEKNLKIFLAGCLKFSNFKRVSIFLRLMGLGEWVDKFSFSTRSFLIYLSIYLYMQNSPIGLLIFKDSASPMQYYPVSRALGCIKDISKIFPSPIIKKLEDMVNSNSIPDPKNVNPLGMIELELFFESVVEEHENLQNDIINNCNKLYQACCADKIPKQSFMMLITSVSHGNSKTFDSDKAKSVLEKVFDVSLEEAIEVCCKLCLLTTYDVLSYVGDIAEMHPEEARNQIKNRLKNSQYEISGSVVNTVDQVEPLYGLVWMKVLSN